MTLIQEVPTGSGSFGRGELFRVAARDSADAAVRAVITSQVRELRGDDSSDITGSLIHSPTHSGDTPIPLDAVARETSWHEMKAHLERFTDNGRHLVEAGEEAGVGTRVLRPGTIIARLDALDGSTNAGSTMSNWSSVALVDEVRVPEGPLARVHHHAGAISISNGWTVSWVNESKFDNARQRYNHVRGRVFMSLPAWGVEEFEVSDARWDRRPNSFAAVASRRRRFESVINILDRVWDNDPLLYNVAGTPIVAALIAGQIENNVEPMWVTLHDSAHLLPHQLLQGFLRGIETGAPLDYLSLYERNAINLDPSHAPVPPYWASAGIS